MADTHSVAYQLGFALFVELEERGWSRHDLAEKTGISYFTVCKMLKGDGALLQNFDACFAALDIYPSIKPMDRT